MHHSPLNSPILSPYSEMVSALEAETAKRDVLVAEVERRCAPTGDDATFQRMSASALITQIKGLENAYSELRAQQLKVVTKLPTAEERTEATNYLSHYERIQTEALTKMRELLAEIKKVRLQSKSEIKVVTQRSPEVGTFDGNPSNWPAFRDLFVAEVHSKAEMDDVTKLIYLQRACIHQAKGTLGIWQPIKGNYDQAWATMRNKYDDDFRVIQALWDKLFKIKKHHEETNINLRNVIDITTSTIRQLEVLGERIELMDSVLIYITLQRLPGTVIDSWEQKRIVGVTPTMSELLEFLEGKARGRIYIDNNDSDPRENKNRQFDRKAYRYNNRTDHHNNTRLTKPQTEIRPSTERINNHIEDKRAQEPHRRINCKKCNGDHGTAKCPQWASMGIEQRRHIVQGWDNTCPNCFRYGHNAASCFYGDCTLCPGEKHNSILCTKGMHAKVNATERKRTYNQANHNYN